MATLDKGIPELWDCAINGVGYNIAWEIDGFQSYANIGVRSYQKIGEDLLVQRNDFSEDMSENKIDSLFWSSNRSFHGGGGQKRANVPQISDDEKWLKAKNVDPFSKLGQLTASKCIGDESANPASSNTQTEGFCTATTTYLYYASPDASATTRIDLRSITAWNGAISTRQTGFGAGYEVQGLCTDGQYVYAANHDGAAGGINRGLLSQQTTNLTSWSTTEVRDIAFVKDRIMGWSLNGSSQVVITEFAIGASPTENVVQTLNPGWQIRTSEAATLGAQRVFAEIQGFIVWIATNGTDGYLWMWDGVNEPFKAARFPGFQAVGVVSYAEQTLYVIGRDPSGAPHSDSWVLIRCDVSPAGSVNWDVIHQVYGVPMPRMAVQGKEIIFPARLPATEWQGLTSDSGVASNIAYTIGSLYYPTEGLHLGRYWGRGQAMSAQMWGESKWTKPDITVFQGSPVITSENGGVRRMYSTYYANAELVSSAIDYNIDTTKLFYMAEAGMAKLPANTTVALQYSADDPEFTTPTWTTIATVSATNSTLLRSRLGTDGVGVPGQVLSYRLQMTTSSGTNTPLIRKAGLGALYGQKPTYQHMVALKAYDRLQLNNMANHPDQGSALAWTIQSALETLRDNQTVVDFQEPRGGIDPATAIKVRVAEVRTLKTFKVGTGFENIVYVRLMEMPDNA